ncbi:hypothetical protein ACQ4PT_025932 [Festuca glaucescens]
MAPFPSGMMSPVVDLFLREVWKPIKKHFGYCLKPESKVSKLAKAADDLKENIDLVKEKIKLGELEGKRPRVQATRWIDGSAQLVEDESCRIKNTYDGRSTHMFGCSWNCFFNYRISSAATKKRADADVFKASTPKNDSIFSLLPPVGRELPLPPNIVGQNWYMKEIAACIKQGTTSFIGICGMGGAGKTTLLKQLNNIFSCAAETHEFDYIIYVEVGQQQDLDMVRKNVASQLGLVIGKDESTTFRSSSLYNFLKERKFLLLIDDLWQTLDIVQIGIPQVDRTQAYVEELESLIWLQSLGFTVDDSESLHRILNFSNNSLKFLNVQGVEGLQVLHISPSLIGIMRAHQLEKLMFRGMKSLEELLIGETIVDSYWNFQSLDDLILVDLPKLESIVWKGVVPHVCLPTLRFLVIYGCHSIKTLTWIKELPCLKEIYLIDCDSMLELAADDEEANTSTAAPSFPRLKLLGLSQLGNLQNICGGTLYFPCFQRLLVYKCPMLVKLPSGLLTEERVPLILGRQDWWEKLCWEDSSVESTLFPFFRELPASFRGNFVDVGNALIM